MTPVTYRPANVQEDKGVGLLGGDRRGDIRGRNKRRVYYYYSIYHKTKFSLCLCGRRERGERVQTAGPRPDPSDPHTYLLPAPLALNECPPKGTWPHV